MLNQISRSESCSWGSGDQACNTGREIAQDQQQPSAGQKGVIGVTVAGPIASERTPWKRVWLPESGIARLAIKRVCLHESGLPGRAGHKYFGLRAGLLPVRSPGSG